MSVRKELARAALFAVVYFVGSELGYALSLGPSVGGTFWPPAGISLAVFLAARVGTWPLLAAAAVAANYASDDLHGQLLPASIAFAIANIGEPLLGAFVLRRLLPGRVTFSHIQDLVGLALIVTFVSAPLAAAIGAQFAELYTRNPPGFAAGWRTWWVGDFVGALVLTPAVFRLIAERRQLLTVRRRTWAEAAAFGVLVLTVTQVVFTAPASSLAMPFLVFPVLLWGSLRLGVVAVGGALCLVVALATHDTASGYGPFAVERLSVGDRLIALQVYIGVMAMSFYALALLWEDRARTAAALRLAHSGLEARYRRIVEQSPLSIVIVQRGGRVVDINPAGRRFGAAGTGGDPDEPSWRDPRVEPLLSRAFGGEVVELPERDIQVEGDAGVEPRRVWGVAYPVKDERGGVAEVALIEQDITDEVIARQQLLDANRALRQREEELSHALREMASAQSYREQLLHAERFARAEAERASQLKDEFLATLSHELRTPLNAIVGWAHILRRSTVDPALVRPIDTIERNARAQSKLIEDLLDMSRIMAGKLGLSIARCRLVDIVTAAAEALQPAARARGVTLALATDEGENAWVAGDAPRLQQVVTNLLDNGIKFTPSGGRVEVAVRTGPGDARITVRDTGQGIPVEFLPAVFDRFRQADATTTRQHGGLGLGLSIAKQIAEMHGGTISVQSEGRGHGAQFTVTLPLAAGDAYSGAAAEPADESTIGGLRVLLVDDDEDARELLRRILGDHGCDVVCAAGAEAALAALDARRFDVLLTDIGMPEMDGYELLARVRSGGQAALPAIAVTAFARPEDRERARSAGFDDHLPKPVDPGHLLQLLARLTSESGRSGVSDTPA